MTPTSLQRSQSFTFEEFQSKIEREFIDGSAISPELFAASIEFIEDRGRWEPNYALNHKVSLQWQTHRPHSFGTIACINNEDGGLWQAKPQNPRIDSKGKTQRYESIKDAGARALLPAIDEKTWRKICDRNSIAVESIWLEKLAEAARQNALNTLFQKWSGFGSSRVLETSGKSSGTGFSSSCSEASTRNQALETLQKLLQSNTQELHLLQQGKLSPDANTALCGFVANLPSQIRVPNFWKWLERHPEIEIIVTEGGKKSLSLLTQGYVAIALYGVDGGCVVYDRIGNEKIRKLKPELIADLKRFAVKGRRVTLAFDQDAAIAQRSRVSSALGRLGGVFASEGCDLSIATWDGRDGKGIDDLIVNCGVEAWEKSYAEAVSFAQWSISYQLAHEVKRKPDLNIGDREFIAVASELPREGIVALWGGKGSGKSKAIGELIKWMKWLSITHLSSLGRDQAAGWGGVFVNDGDRHGSKLLKDGVPVNGGSVCVPSLLKVSAVDADVLVLDEISATLEFILGSKLTNKDGMRSLLLTELIKRIRAPRLVLIADADLSEEALQFIECIRGERAYLVKSERQALTYEATIIDGTKNAAIALLQQRIEESNNDKIFYINADAKAVAETITELLGRDKTLLITGDTSGGEIEASFLASKGRDLPGLFAQGVRFIISSPSVTQGFSIEHHTDLIDSVWGFYSGCSISAHQIAQAPDRVRNAHVPRFFWVAKKGSATSRLSKAQSITAFLKEFKQLNSTAARLVAHSLTPEATIAAEEMDWQSQNLRMLAALEVRRNRGMGSLRETLIALLKKEGKRVSIFKPQFSKVQLSAIAATVSSASSAVKTRHHEAVASAETIDKEAAKALSESSETLTPDQVLSLEKFYIAEFYRLESVSVSAVVFDKKGATRKQIKALEAVLLIDVANETTARTINQNPENPQDWNPIAVKVRLLEQSGAAALIREIAAGKVESLDAEQVALIAAFIRAHAAEFRIGFNFCNVANLSDQQIVGEILQRHGIKTKRRGNKNNLRYEVCKPELEAILAVVERRKNANSLAAPEVIAPPLDQGVNQRGAIAVRPAQNLESWLTPECLADMRETWALADSEELRDELRKVYPIEALERAIA